MWVVFEEDGSSLAGLQRQVERRLEPFAEKVGAENFLAHATLGRFQKYRRHKIEIVLPRMRALANHVFGEWCAEDVGLFRSELSPEGARHTKVAVFPFGASLGM